MTTTQGRPTVMVIGGGFAGFYAIRRLQRVLGGKADLVLVTASDYLLYAPLLPEVANGVLEPRDIAVPYRQTLRGVRVLVGRVRELDLTAHTIGLDCPEEGQVDLRWDRLVIAPGSVTRQFDIPGLREHAHGMKTLREATYLRDHIIAQLDRADALPEGPENDDERRRRLTVVAVGAGYTGTELVAQLQFWVSRVTGRWGRLDPSQVRWVLVDVAPQVLPELGSRLGAHALGRLRRRGIEVRLGVSLSEVDDEGVTLTDGTRIATNTVVWSAGIVPSPLMASLGLPTQRGRLEVGPDLAVRGAPHVWALGDAAAVPDLAVSERSDNAGGRPITAPTAQHAQRQGPVAAANVAASLGLGVSRTYRHRDLGLVADLGGWDAVAKPLGVPLTGPVAKAVARGYHLLALPSLSARVRVATNWLYASVLPTRVARLDLVRRDDALIDRAQGIEDAGVPGS
ncbi:MAG: NAD(P)/FAD-dependent oxidoreductase [Humibacillus sp.]|nr:NAD(P)/FAD-dependent oxidoreductase [Humibacillus sp.]MDN5775831.1 NAD(P)/FAD-dependent oxidoreductase [Humibacillus sp.]